MEEKVIFNLEFPGADDILTEIVRIQDATKALKGQKDKLTEAALHGGLEEEKALKRLEIQIKENNKEVNALTRQYGAQAKEVKNSTGSLVEMRKELRQMVATYDGLSKEQRENTDTGLAMKDSIAALTAELKEAEGATGRHQRNVGNYMEAVDTANMSIREMQVQLRELKKVSQEDLSPDQVLKLEQAMGQLQDATGKANARIKVQAMDDIPALVASLQGVVAASQLVVGAMGLIGVDDERVKKLTQTMVQLVGVSQSLATINQLIASGEAAALAVKVKTIALNTVLAAKIGIVTAAQWLWNAAMSANPIGLIVIAITALLVLLASLARAMQPVINMFGLAEKATETAAEKVVRYRKELENLEQSQKALIRTQKEEIELLKAKGASLETLEQAERDLMIQQIEFAKARIELQVNEAKAIIQTAGAAARLMGLNEERIEQYFRQKDGIEELERQLMLFDTRAAKRRDDEIRKERDQREKANREALIREEKAALQLAVVNAENREQELQARIEQIRRLAEMELENRELTESERLLIKAEAFNREQELINAHHEWILDKEKTLADEKRKIAEQEDADERELQRLKDEREKAAVKLKQDLADASIDISYNLFETLKTIAGKESALAKAAKAIQKGIALVEIGINLQRELAAIRVAAAVQNALLPGSGLITERIQSIRALTQSAVAAARVLALNSGGVVGGAKTGRDTVPAMLTPGEGVLREQAMSANDHYSLTGTPKQIASYLNQQYGGVAFHNRGGMVGAGTASGSVRNVRNELSQEKLVQAFGEITIITTVEDINNGVTNEAIRNQIANY